MVSKQNRRLLLEKRSDKREFHYGLRKLTVGVASVLLGTTVFLGGQAVHADTVNSEDTQTQVKQPVASEFSTNSASASSNQVLASESSSSAASSEAANHTQNISQGVNQAPLSVNQISVRTGSQVNANISNKDLPNRGAFNSISDLPATNSAANFKSSADAVSKVQAPASNVIKPVAPRRMVMVANDSHYQMNKVVSTGRDLWMAFDVPFVWYQPSQLGNGVLALGDGHHNGDLAPWKFQVYTQWHRNSDNGQWQFVSGYTSDPAHYALETSEVKILGSQSQNGHTFTVVALPITVNAYTLKDQLQSGGYYIMVPGLNAQAGLDQSSGSWTASIPVGANGQIPLVRLGATVSKIQYVTGTNHDQVISSVNVHQDIIRNGSAQAVNLSGIPSDYRLEYEQPSLTPVYSGYIPNDTAVNHSNCYVSINSDNTLTVSVPVVKATTEQTIIVRYVDDDDNGRVLQTDTIKGPAGSLSTYTTAKELGILSAQHYLLSSDETNGKPLVFDADNNKDQVYTVHVKHETEDFPAIFVVNGTISYANTPGDLIKVPSDQMSSSESLSLGSDGRSFTRDLVTNRWSIPGVSILPVHLNNINGFWLVPVSSSSSLVSQNNWGSAMNTPLLSLDGLTGSDDIVSLSKGNAEISVDFSDYDELSLQAVTINVNYHYQYIPAPESAKITYVDDTTGNTLKTEEIAADYDTYVGMDTPGGPDVTRAANGYGSKIQFKTDPAAQIKLYQDQGYQLVSSNFTEGATFNDGDVANVFTVHLAHAMTPVKPSKPINSGQTTSGRRPINGAHESDLNKTVTRTIVLKTPGQADQTIIQTVKLTRSASVDEVTGHVTYGTWSTGSWPDYHVPAKAHYTADKTMIASQMVDDTTVDQTVTVSYSLNKSATQYTITVKYVDDDNNGALVGKAVTVSGNNVDFNLSIPANYGLVVGQVFPTKVDASVDGKSYVVHLCHLKEVTARAKRVKRVINYVDEQGHSLHQSVTQDAGIVVEYGNKDLVTGDVVWGQYHADVPVGSMEGAFGEWHLPQYEGFTSYVNGVKSTVVPKAYVTYDANGKPIQLDTTVEVTYQSDQDLSNPSQPEIDSKSNDDQSGDTFTARRIIHIYALDGTDQFVAQSIHFVKDHDQKTLAAVTNPQIAGYYTASQQVDGVTVDYESADKLVKTVNVVYHLAPESLHVHFYDVNGNLIQSADVSGKYGQTIDVHSVLPAGWQLYADQIVPNAVKLGVYNADLAFVLDHKIAEIKPEMNVSTTDVIPGTNQLTYPSEVLSSNLNRDLVYTVNVKYPDGKVEPKVFKQHVSRSAYLDLVTGKVISYSKWTNNGQHTFSSFVAQPKDGYMVDTLPAVTLDVDHPTKTVEVSYVPKTINGQVVYKTFAGQTVDTQNFTGNQLVNFVVPTGYKLITNVFSLQPTNEADQKYIVYVIPQVMTYTRHDDNKPANIGDLTKIVTRTININLPNGRVRAIKQNVQFIRTATVKADGSIEYSNWQATGRTVMNKVFLPKRHGYHIVIDGDLAKMNVTADMSNLAVNAKYVKD